MTKKKAVRWDLAAAVLLFLAMIPAQYFEVFALLEDQTLSFRHQLRLKWGEPAAVSFSRDVVFVNTDEKFFQSYKSFPLRRTDIAAIVTNLHDLGAKVVAVDMLMDFPSSYGEDPALAEALGKAGNTLLVAQGNVKGGRMVGLTYPTATLDAASASAYSNISSASSLVTSLSRLKIYPEATAQKGGWPFAVKAAAMYLGVEPKLAPGLLTLGDLRIPLDHAGNLPIDFPALTGGTRFLSQTAGISALEFIDISGLDPYDREELASWVRDKIVLVGDTSEVSHDWFDTPVGMVYGVEIIGDTISTLLKGGPLRPASLPQQLAAAAILLALVLALAIRLHAPLGRGLGFLAVGLGFVAVDSALYVRHGLVLPMFYMLAATVLGYLLVEFRQYLQERDQKRQIARTFGQYIPQELVAEMAKTGQEVSVGGESREMTVLFSDVRGFTTISEGLAPQELTVLMNAFLSPMTRVIHNHRGTIDKYMGDAIMAFWGAPLTDPDHATHAVQAALAMTRTMDDLAGDFVARGWKPIKVGIGLNTGVMSVGNMGSDFRLAYTVMGDAVNLGSRIESLTKQYGVGTMVSEYTQAAVPALVSRELDMVRVKGKDTPVRLFQPIGFPGEVAETVLADLERHHAALARYRAQDWDAAKAGFESLAAADPERKIYQIYLDRIAHFLESPPGPDWDGVFTHKEK